MAANSKIFSALNKLNSFNGNTQLEDVLYEVTNTTFSIRRKVKTVDFGNDYIIEVAESI